MTGVAGQRPMMPPCPRCTGLGGVHWLTCPTLRLPESSQDVATRQMREWYGPDWQPPERDMPP